jgi:beta-N-acetylglucosaminidase
MRFKHPTILVAMVCLIGLISGYVLQVHAETQVRTQNTAGTESGKEVLVMAVALNNDIKEETDRIREQKRLSQEKYNNFVSNALRHKFVNYDIRTKTGLKGYQLDVILKGTKLEGLGNAYAKAEEQYSVSSLVLMGISAHESAWGTSRLSNERNNLFGFQAYDGDINAAKHFVSKEECILVVAKHLSDKYLTVGAPYYKGFTLADVNIRYASDKEWNSKITETLNSFVSKLK